MPPPAGDGEQRADTRGVDEGEVGEVKDEAPRARSDRSEQRDAEIRRGREVKLPDNRIHAGRTCSAWGLCTFPLPAYSALDVVHRSARLLGFPLRNFGDRRSLELRAHLFGYFGPWRAEGCGSGSHLSLEQLDHFEDRDLFGRSCERITTLDTALRLEDTATPQCDEERLEELRRDVTARGDIADRHR